MNYNFVAPTFSLTEDNESEITKTLVRFIGRGRFPEPSAEDGSDFWFCNRCPNDDNYCQPWIVGDKIYFQLPYIPFNPPPDEFGFTYLFDPFFNIVEDGVSSVITSGITTQIGFGESNGIHYINVCLDTSDPFFANVDCFYFQIAPQDSKLNVDPTGTPIGEPMRSCFLSRLATNGNDYNEAIAHCANIYLTAKFNSQSFCLAKCNESTILIEGNYEQDQFGRRPLANFEITDCANVFHGVMVVNGFNQFNIFKHIYRVRGVVETNGFQFEESIVRRTRTSSKQREVFVLYTKKIPYFVAVQIAACFNSKELKIDSVEYFGGQTLLKNFEEGNMFIIKENLYIDCDRIDFSCV